MPYIPKARVCKYCFNRKFRFCNNRSNEKPQYYVIQFNFIIIPRVFALVLGF